VASSPDLTPCDLTSFCAVMWSKKCLCHLCHWIMMNWSWELPQLLRQWTGTCSREWITDWAFVRSQMECTLNIFRVCKAF
jgi:hypothetical protein